MNGGFFISPKGDIESVYEHLAAIEQDPEHFGLTKADIKNLPPVGVPRNEAREKLVKRITMSGWIRVRGHREYMTFESWRISDDMIANVKDFLQKKQICYARLMLGELATGKTMDVSAQDILMDRVYIYANNPKGKSPTVDVISFSDN